MNTTFFFSGSAAEGAALSNGSNAAEYCKMAIYMGMLPKEYQEMIFSKFGLETLELKSEEGGKDEDEEKNKPFIR